MKTAKFLFAWTRIVEVMLCATIFLVLVSGCASIEIISSAGVSLEELEAQALTTGNWSKVERKEARMRQEQEHAAQVQYCVDHGQRLVCEGISRRYLDCFCAR
jgi:hypothetical protein